MSFVLCSSHGILKNGKKFIGTTPTPPPLKPAHVQGPPPPEPTSKGSEVETIYLNDDESLEGLGHISEERLTVNLKLHRKTNVEQVGVVNACSLTTTARRQNSSDSAEASKKSSTLTMGSVRSDLTKDSVRLSFTLEPERSSDLTESARLSNSEITLLERETTTANPMLSSQEPAPLKIVALSTTTDAPTSNYMVEPDVITDETGILPTDHSSNALVDGNNFYMELDSNESPQIPQPPATPASPDVRMDVEILETSSTPSDGQHLQYIEVPQFEKINHKEEIKPALGNKIEGKSDPEMGIYYSCPRCQLRYVSAECVEEHLQLLLSCQPSKRRINNQKADNTIPHDIMPTQTPVNDYQMEDEVEESDNNSDDPDFAPEECTQRRVFKFPCHLCTKRFDSLVGLRNHERIIHGKRSNDTKVHIVCKICNQKFILNHSLKQHLRNIHKLSEEAILTWVKEGDVVPKTNFSENKSANNPTPKKLRPGKKAAITVLACSQCSSTFPTTAELAAHELEHRLMALKPHKCDFCDQSFSLKSYLEYHEKSHVNEYPYSCKVCGDLYSSHKDLKAHCYESRVCAAGNNISLDDVSTIIVCD